MARAVPTARPHAPKRLRSDLLPFFYYFPLYFPQFCFGRPWAFRASHSPTRAPWKIVSSLSHSHLPPSSTWLVFSFGPLFGWPPGPPTGLVLVPSLGGLLGRPLGSFLGIHDLSWYAGCDIGLCRPRCTQRFSSIPWHEEMPPSEVLQRKRPPTKVLGV